MRAQQIVARLAWQGKGETTRRKRFLAGMGVVIPLDRALALITPR